MNWPPPAEKIRSSSAARLLAKSPRPLAVLELAAEKAGWGKPLAKGRGRGIALVNNIGSFTAQVAEASVRSGQTARASRGLRGRLRPGGEPGRESSSRSRAASCMG